MKKAVPHRGQRNSVFLLAVLVSWKIFLDTSIKNRMRSVSCPQAVVSCLKCVHNKPASAPETLMWIVF